MAEIDSTIHASPCFGYEWVTLDNKRAFCWTVTKGPSSIDLQGVVFDEGKGIWTNEIATSATLALRRPAKGRIPNPAQLRKRLLEILAANFDVWIRPDGTM